EVRHDQHRAWRTLGRHRAMHQSGNLGLPLPHPAARRVRPRHVRDGDRARRRMTALAISPDRENERLVLHAAPERLPLWRAFLRVPLLGKVLGANLLLIAAAVAGHFALPFATAAIQLSVLLCLSFALTTALVWLALRPIAELEDTAHRVTAGDFSARVPMSVLADRDILSLSSTMNRLLDRVTSDRARIQHLAGRSVRARDVEREAVARELRDSLAQTLAGIGMQLSAADLVNRDPDVATQLRSTRDLVEQLTDEMRSVAETLYPGTLGEFGLVNAIEALGRRIARRSGLRISVEGGSFNAPMSTAAASALYRVADEALRNVEQHAQASTVRVTLCPSDEISLSIEDDGRGVDMRDHDPLQAGLGLFSAKVVLALAGGDLQISSGPGLGTRILARVPASTTMGRVA